MGSRVRRKGRDVKGFANGLRSLPRVGAINVARRASTALTGAVTGSFDAGMTAYDEARPLGSKGQQLTLRKTGTVRSLLRFAHDGGIKLRIVLATTYAKYLIRFGILPRGGDPIPRKWQGLLDQATQAGMSEEAAKL